MTPRDRLRWYGLPGTLRLLGDLLLTKLQFPRARLIRRPLNLRGKKWMRIGRRLTTGPGLRLDAMPVSSAGGPVLFLDDDIQINDSVHIAASSMVHIGNRVLIASKVFITDHNHGTYSGTGSHTDPRIPPAARPLSTAPVIIEDDVWIGEFVAILPGVTVGKGAIIGTMSVVTHNIPAYTIAIGSPARVIKRFNFQTSQWEPV